jgi:hypothetical protein
MKNINLNEMRIQKFFSKSTLYRKLLPAAVFGLIFLAFASSQAQAAVYTVTNLNDSGAGSLRQAIIDANASVGVADTINVNATTPGTIDLLTPLPAITDTAAIININTGSGRIELNGLATQIAGDASIGFDIQAPNCEIWGFTINRFGEAGIRVGPNAAGTSNGSGTIIHQNYIGTNRDGSTTNCPDEKHQCGNFNRGVWIDGASNVQVGVGGFGGHSNTISGNFGRGISVNNKVIGATTFSGSAIIRNNYIGTSNSFPTQNADIGNSQDGIMLAGSSNNTIGGINSNDRNVILGNDGNGIAILADVNYPASNNVIKGNYIGHTSGSVGAVGNDGSGILIQGATNTVGGTTTAERNFIVGNKVNGITINSLMATGNVVQGNYIGTGSDGTTALGNNNNGIQIANFASGNTIGGTTGATLGATPSCTGACNIIANNGNAASQTAKSGLYLDPTAANGNAIRANYIFNNVGTGIDLGTPGDTANDATDTDTGPNDLQNKPTLTAANTTGFISGTLVSTPSTAFAIDFFRNTSGDGATSEGRVYIGSVNTSTNGSGSATFTFTTAATLSTGEFITATATATGTAIAPQAVGDTSEFSAAQAVVFAPPTAASADLAGRITDTNGVGIEGVTVSLVDTGNGETSTVTTNNKGFYAFGAVPVGRSYVITPSSKRYDFEPSSRVVSHMDEATQVNFTAQPKTKSRAMTKR